MVLATKVVERFAAYLGVESSVVDWFWRSLREAKLVPPGKRGPSGAPADVGVIEASRLILAYLSGEGARSAPGAVERIAGFRRVGEDVGFDGTFEERLCDITQHINHRQELLTGWEKDSGPVVASIAVVRNAAGVEWAEVAYFINSSLGRYSGGLHDCNMREVYADPAIGLTIEHVRSAATYVKECRLHGSVLPEMRFLIEAGESDDSITD